MDERDCRILMALTRSPFDSLESIGRAVGTSGTAVKARLDRLAAAGIYGGLVCAPSGRAFGRFERLAAYDAGPFDAPLADVLRVDDVAWVARAYPTAAVVMLYTATPDEPLPRALAQVVGRAPDSIGAPADPAWRRARGPLSPLDWRVLDAVMADPRAPLREQAERAKLSARTVRERRDALLEGHDLMCYPVIDATREEGMILYTAYVALDAPESARNLRLTNAQRVVTHHEPPAVFLTGYARTYAETHVIEGKLRATEGVKHVAFSVPHQMTVASERLAAWTRAEIDRWSLARRRAVV